MKALGFSTRTVAGRLSKFAVLRPISRSDKQKKGLGYKNLPGLPLQRSNNPKALAKLAEGSLGTKEFSI